MLKLTIKKYQDYLKNVYKNRNNDQGLFIKLVEEIGEVAEQISIRDGRKDGDKEAVLEEFRKRTCGRNLLHDCYCRSKRN